MDILYKNLLCFDASHVVMILIGCVLIFLAIHKEMEPSLLLPMGFGTILVTFLGLMHSEALFLNCTKPASATSCSPCCCSSALAQ